MLDSESEWEEGEWKKTVEKGRNKGEKRGNRNLHQWKGQKGETNQKAPKGPMTFYEQEYQKQEMGEEGKGGQEWNQLNVESLTAESARRYYVTDIQTGNKTVVQGRVIGSSQNQKDTRVYGEPVKLQQAQWKRNEDQERYQDKARIRQLEQIVEKSLKTEQVDRHSLWKRRIG